MAAGDVVNYIHNVSGGCFTYQPAASVEVVVTSCWTASTGNAIYLTNGVTAAQVIPAQVSNYLNLKIFINNTNYLQVCGGSQYPAFSGVQTK